jgi:hypothetical protein
VRRRGAIAALGAVAALACGVAWAEEKTLLRNGSFGEWKDGVPVGWTVGVGASRGEGPSSVVEPGKDGGVSLAGDASTRVWKMVSQTVDVEAGSPHRLTFSARLLGVTTDPARRAIPYVGIVPRTDRGLDMRAASLETTLPGTWTPCSVLARAGGPRVDVAAFLPVPGRLEVRDVVLAPIAPEDAFDVFVDHVDRTYPFFAERGPFPEGRDWRAHAATFRERAVAAQAPDRLVEVLSAMLQDLKDAHVVIRRPGKPSVVPWSGPVAIGFDPREVAGRLTDVKSTRNLFLTGRLAPDVGYAAIAALPPKPDADALVAAVEAQYAAKALVLDLRPCGGGDETVGLRIAAAFADEPRLYARRRFRSGPKHDDFGDWIDATVAPREGARFTGPVVVILGPGCVSSGEGFAQALEVLPTVTTVGRPTRGASANPAPIPLPDGIDVMMSRWQNARADGSLTEGKGIPPQLLVEATSPGDPALDKAIEIVRAKLAGTASPR